jgi:hypothetical protein
VKLLNIAASERRRLVSHKDSSARLRASEDGMARHCGAFLQIFTLIKCVRARVFVIAAGRTGCRHTARTPCCMIPAGVRSFDKTATLKQSSGTWRPSLQPASTCSSQFSWESAEMSPPRCSSVTWNSGAGGWRAGRGLIKGMRTVHWKR